jgi:hypothetical protein
MGIVLVTVAYGARRRDLAVCADVPIADLLGPLTEALSDDAHLSGAARGVASGCEARPGEGVVNELALAPLCGPPLPLERSLEACGVGHGAVLALIAPHPGASP